MITTKPQLFLIHFSGGNIYSYQFLKPYLQDFEVMPLELPGRGKRIDEKVITDFNKAVEDLYRQIVQKLNGNDFYLFGHSMGALLALRLVKILEDNRFNPKGLVATGSPGPGGYIRKKRFLLDDESLKKELHQMGGMPQEVLEDEELFHFFKPLIISDFEIIEAQDLSKYFFPVNASIYAVMGDQEETVSNIDNWKNFTKSRCNFKILSGNHFFLYQHPEQIASIIKLNISQGRDS